MPIYEYACPQCGEEFEKLVRSMSAADEVNCPVCNSRHVKRKLSLIASKGSKSGSSFGSLGAAPCAPGGA